ncbi:MAG: biotin/lipoyl-containing protein, partial [Chitinophagaceae bacterium]
LGEKLEVIKSNYQIVNELFGNIVKVTPSSKVVGDMALFMTANNLTAEDILDGTKNISFPESVRGFFRGDLGIPYGGFPQPLQKIILKQEFPLNSHLKETLPDVDFGLEFANFQVRFPDTHFLDFLSFKMFPKVFEDYYRHCQEYGYLSDIPTPAFFYPMKSGEEILINFSPGKTIIVKLLFVLPTDENGMRAVSFELNGYNRMVQVRDKSYASIKPVHAKVEFPATQIGAPLQGKLSSLLIKEGEEVTANAPLFTIEAMKMETTVTATREGKVKKIYLKAGTMVQQQDLVVEFYSGEI